ncbi:site-specific integrase [Novosphingobium sp. ERN07]|uniref:site-specific integrase n=1 Tax=Novosphingobium sp. ERN07 TaxID=2726187 RepID=UPI001456C0B1|nr:site-specific integrase [Novosphingobium sp. ERN07]NLR70678.1 site-specific integrase [Novosphingobium sp. ERN07]
MNDVGKPTGLVKRKGSAVWYFRQRCPKHLKAQGSPADIWISLETASYPTALTRVEGARLEAMRRFSARPTTSIYSRSAPSGRIVDESWPVLESEQAGPLARAFLADAVRELDCERQIDADIDKDRINAWRVELEGMLARLTGPLPDDGIDDVAGAKYGVLRKAKLRAEPGSEACNLLHNYLRRAMAQATRIELARMRGDYADRITDRLFASALTAGVAIPTAYVNGVPMASPVGVIVTPLSDAVDRYQATLFSKSTTDKTKDRYRSELRHIVSFFGADYPVWKLTADECDRFREAFSLLPPNFEDQIRKGKDVASIVSTRGEDDPTLAWATLDKYLSQLSRFVSWAHKRDYVAKDYAAGLKPLAVKPDGSMAKLPFEDDELRRIFQRPIYTGCLNDRVGFSRAGPNIIRRARYWAPLIGLFSGLRCGEILQLTTEHFRVSPKGNHFIVLTPDMKLKTKNAVREIPLHPVLQAIGLVDWVARRRSRGEIELFPEVPAHSSYKDRSSRFSKWYESDLRHFELGERRPKLTFHSFRHTFKRGLDRADVPEDKKEELCGWARGKRTSRRYGLGLEADVLKPCVDAIDYGLDLSHLHGHAKLVD